MSGTLLPTHQMYFNIIVPQGSILGRLLPWSDLFSWTWLCTVQERRWQNPNFWAVFSRLPHTQRCLHVFFCEMFSLHASFGVCCSFGIIQVIHNYNLKFPKWGMVRHSLIAPNPSPIPQSRVMTGPFSFRLGYFLGKGSILQLHIFSRL